MVIVMLKPTLIKKSVIAIILMSSSSYVFSDTQSKNTLAEENHSELYRMLYQDASLDLNTNLYTRYRAVKSRDSGKYGLGPGGIQNQTAMLALNYKSGYYNDIIGFDFWGGTNIKLGHTVGQSEILYYKYSCDGDGKFSPCEKSLASVSVAALKLKYGSDAARFKINAGYTPINSGTFKNSWGLGPHSYRGFDSALSFDNLSFTYAWADRFKNDWSRDFKKMTTSWHQNNAAGLDDGGTIIKKGDVIDYIHSVGVVYELDKSKVDVGYGEGHEYRRNWQLQLEHVNQLATDTSLQTKIFYQGARYIHGIAPVVSPKYEYYVSAGLNLKNRNTTWSVGYSQNHAPQTADYNFRLTPWANSDKRDYQATLSQLEDYNASGTQALRLGVTHNFADYNLPEFTMGLAGTYGWHVVTDTAKINAARTYDGKMRSLDLLMRYNVEDGPVKGLSVTVLPALLRTSETNYKTSRNDIKFIVGYSVNLF